MNCGSTFLQHFTWYFSLDAQLYWDKMYWKNYRAMVLVLLY